MDGSPPRRSRYKKVAWYALVAGLLSYGAYYLACCVKVPEVRRRRKAPWVERVLAHCPTLRERYWVTPWAVNAHAQLVMYILASSVERPPKFDRQLVRLPDGEDLAVDWHLAQGGAPAAPTVVYLHGITGDAHSVASFVKATAARGWHSCVVNRRGHGGVKLKRPTVNCMGDTHDMRHAVRHIRDRVATELPGSPLFLVGVSAGSGLLVRYLGEEETESPFRAAASLCPGYDIAECFQRLHPLYDRALVKRCKQFFIGDNEHVFGEHEHFKSVMEARTMHEFIVAASHMSRPASSIKLDSMWSRERVPADVVSRDAIAAAARKAYPDPRTQDPAHDDAFREWLWRSNPMDVANNISTPLLVLNALDDPVCDASNIPEGEAAEALLHDRALLVLTERGSHCAFYEGLLAQSSWMERMTLDFFGAVLAAEAEAEAEAEAAGAAGAAFKTMRCGTGSAEVASGMGHHAAR